MRKLCQNVYFKTRKVLDKDIYEDLILVKVFIDTSQPFEGQELFLIGYKLTENYKN